MSGLGAAIGLLTRIPIGSAALQRADMSRSVKWIPLVGAFIGLAVAAAYAGLRSLLPGWVAAGLAVACGALITGALHEDGLADTVDGFGGGSNREDKLRIMKDPVHGTYGVLALIFSVVIRVGALATLGVGASFVVLPAAHVLSRGGAIVLMGILPPATTDGLGAAHADPGVRRRVMAGMLISLLIGVVALGWWVVVFGALAGAGSLVIGLLARRHIAGFTGDVLGAAQQTGEILLMVLGASLVSGGVTVWFWWR